MNVEQVAKKRKGNYWKEEISWHLYYQKKMKAMRYDVIHTYIHVTHVHLLCVQFVIMCSWS